MIGFRHFIILTFILLFTLVFEGGVIASNIVINEILPNPENEDWNSDGTSGSGQSVNDSWIEIFNTSSESVDLSGWYLDDYPGGGSSPYQIPSGTTIAGRGFLVFYGSETGLSLYHTNDYARVLNSSQEEQDSYHYTSNPGNDNSYGRNPDGTGGFAKFEYGSDSAPTPGSANDPGSFDSENPATTISSPSSDSYHNSAITISGSSSDNSGVDYVNLYYSDNNGASWTQLTQIDDPDNDTIFGWAYDWIPEANGSYSLRAYAVDINGNEEDPINITSVVYDTVAPDTSFELIDGSPPTIDLSANDNNLDKIYYKWDSSDGLFTEYTGPFSALEGDHILYYRASDLADNISDTSSQNISYNPETGESQSSEGESSSSVLGAAKEVTSSETKASNLKRRPVSKTAIDKGEGDSRESSPTRVLVLGSKRLFYDYTNGQEDLVDGEGSSPLFLIGLGLGISFIITLVILNVRERPGTRKRRSKAGEGGPPRNRSVIDT